MASVYTTDVVQVVTVLCEDEEEASTLVDTLEKEFPTIYLEFNLVFNRRMIEITCVTPNQHDMVTKFLEEQGVQGA